MSHLVPTVMGAAIGWAGARIFDGRIGYAVFVLIFGIIISISADRWFPFDGKSEREP